MPKTKQTPYTCPECHSNQTYFRSGTQSHKCKKCGHEWRRGEQVKVVGTDLFGAPVEIENVEAKTHEELMKEIREKYPEAKEYSDEELEGLEFDLRESDEEDTASA